MRAGASSALCDNRSAKIAEAESTPRRHGLACQRKSWFTRLAPLIVQTSGRPEVWCHPRLFSPKRASR